MPRRQNAGVQVGAPVVPVLQGLQALADKALTDVRSVGTDLRHVRDALVAHIDGMAAKIALEMRSEFEQMAVTYKQQAQQEAERKETAARASARERSTTTIAQLRQQHEEELKAVKEEMDTLQHDFKKDLDAWQRQCYYYKTSEANLRKEAEELRSAIPRGALPKRQPRSSPRALQVHDEAQLLKEVHDTKVALEASRREEKTLRLEKKRLKFLLQVVRAKASEQLEEAAVREKHLQHELQETKETLRHTRDLALRGRKGAEQVLRESMEHEFQKKAKAKVMAELKRAEQRESEARSAMMAEHESAIERLHAAHRQQMDELRAAHQQHLAQRDAEHKAEIEELNKSWKKKLVVTQKSLQTLGSSEALQTLATRQAKLLELSAKFGQPPRPSSGSASSSS